MVEVYNDRVVITNPGGLISSIPPEKFGTMSRTRNPLIFGLFERIRLVEHIGSGVMRMRESMKEEQLPPPDFGLIGMFNITLKRPISVEHEIVEKIEALPEIQQKILVLIQLQSTITIPEIGRQLTYSVRKISYAIKQLKELGYIVRIGSRKRGKWNILKKF
jgi:ATP-dependent DNA helicase RecG